MIRVLIALTAAVAGGACASGGRIDQAMAASIDPARIEVVEIARDNGEVLLRGTVNGAEASATASRRGELTSPTGGAARGDAEIRADEILVDVENLPPMTFMTLRVDGEQVLFFRTTKGGSAEVKLLRITPPPSGR